MERDLSSICRERLTHRQLGSKTFLYQHSVVTKEKIQHVTHSVAANDVPHTEGLPKFLLCPTWHFYTTSVIRKRIFISTWHETTTTIIVITTTTRVQITPPRNDLGKLSSPSSREVSGVDQPTLSPCGQLSSLQSSCVVDHVLSTLTSKPTLPCSTPWVSLQPDHNSGNRSQKRGCPREPSECASKWRWLSSVHAKELLSSKQPKLPLFESSIQGHTVSRSILIPNIPNQNAS